MYGDYKDTTDTENQMKGNIFLSESKKDKTDDELDE